MHVHGARSSLARWSVLPLVIAVAGLLAGCGSVSSHTPSRRELALQRSQLVLVSGELRAVEESVHREVTASRSAWPLVADGLPSTFSGQLREAVAKAGAAAKALVEPSFMTQASKLTGPAAGLAGLYESYSRLAERGWRLTEVTIGAIAGGTPPVASFERENSPLYIDAIYDGHFNLSLVGKSIQSAYTRLGGPRAFGSRLTQSEVDSLAGTYSIPTVRLEPHPGRSVEVG
jgi:hypothetical protein